MQPAAQEDANGTRREFSYDNHGNRIAETIIHAAGSLQRDWLFYSPDAFERPIKNRLAVATDYRGTATDFSFDDRGNVVSQTRGGVTETFSYSGSGDRVTERDGSGAVRQLGYDAYGHVRSIADATGQVQQQIWDALGRRTQVTDGEGYVTQLRFDG